MDVPMLREIDIDAFGQRVKIFHGIKQLRQSIDLSPTAVKQDNNWASQSPTAHQVYGTSTHHEATVSDASMYSDPRSEPVQSSSYAHASALVSSIEATPDAESNIRGCDQETTTRNDPMPSEPRVEPADVEGWLRKRGKTLGWKTRYVIVRDSHLYIMHSPLVSLLLPSSIHRTDESVSLFIEAKNLEWVYILGRVHGDSRFED